MRSGHILRLLSVLVAWVATASVTIRAAETLPPAPAPRDRNEVEAVLAKAPSVTPLSELRPINIVLLADEKDHGRNEHDYPLWQKRWKILLGGKAEGDTETQVNLYGPPAAGDPKILFSGAPKVEVTTARKWPSREQLQTADLIVMNCYRSGGGHWQWDKQSPKDLDAYLSRGGGFVMLHPATFMEVDLRRAEWKPLLDLTGLAYGNGNRTRRGTMKIRLAPSHPICRGLPEVIHLVDEPYWPAFGDPHAVEIVGTSAEIAAPRSTDLKPQPMFWTYQRGKGRVFGCAPGHFTWTFDDPYFRLLVLRGMAWAAGESPYRFDGLALRGASLQDTAGKKP